MSAQPQAVKADADHYPRTMTLQPKLGQRSGTVTTLPPHLDDLLAINIEQ